MEWPTSTESTPPASLRERLRRTAVKGGSPQILLPLADGMDEQPTAPPDEMPPSSPEALTSAAMRAEAAAARLSEMERMLEDATRNLAYTTELLRRQMEHVRRKQAEMFLLAFAVGMLAAITAALILAWAK